VLLQETDRLRSRKPKVDAFHSKMGRKNVAERKITKHGSGIKPLLEVVVGLVCMCVGVPIVRQPKQKSNVLPQKAFLARIDLYSARGLIAEGGGMVHGIELGR
jgi:hypothetical protein